MSQLETGNKEYIGDAVYVSVDGLNHIWLETQRPGGHVDRIALEPAVFAQLVMFARKVWPLNPTCIICGRLARK